MKLEQQVVSLKFSKKLKDFGAKQESLFWWHKGFTGKDFEGDFEVGDYFDIRRQPFSAFTLSELIDASGERFFSLMKATDGWYAQEFRNDKRRPRIFRGDTPEEAVARLFMVRIKKEKLYKKNPKHGNRRPKSFEFNTNTGLN